MDVADAGMSALPTWLLDSYEPPEAAIRAGGNVITAALQAMLNEELHPDDLALRVWLAMRQAIADEQHPI